MTACDPPAPADDTTQSGVEQRTVAQSLSAGDSVVFGSNGEVPPVQMEEAAHRRLHPGMGNPGLPVVAADRPFLTRQERAAEMKIEPPRFPFAARDAVDAQMRTQDERPSPEYQARRARLVKKQELFLEAIAAESTELARLPEAERAIRYQKRKAEMLSETDELDSSLQSGVRQ
jgi:hypothetical protein